jgi:class 3 adenylate cyclase
MPEARHGFARLLVVDDNKVNRLLLTRSLEQQGHSVASAENGRVALEMLRREGFDLVLLDMEMPEMDGFQVLEQLVNDLQLRDLPVIVTSSLEGINNVVRCIELGAEDYLTKPVNPVLLKARIGASLEKKRLRDQQKELVRRFATSEVAQDMNESGFALGGKRVSGTVMFADIRGFTALVESQPAEEVIELLNTYYTLMFDAISGHGGVVNQMVGDGLMAIFGAPLPLPDHRGSAVLAAMEMIEMVDLFNLERAAAKKPQIKIGIGIASGEMVAGYTGTHQRATYTCVGDTVNLAARLEAHTKEAGRPILIDEATRAGLGEAIALEALGPVAIKGKAAPVKVFAVTTGK